MKILFASAEVAPYSKTGGLADVAGALPGALRQLGDEVTVITPLYADIDKTKFTIKSTNIRGSVLLGSEPYQYELYEDVDRSAGFPILFVKNSKWFDRTGIYTTPDGQGFHDNNQRFFFYQLVILDLIKQKILDVDLLHCNDHHTGLLPALFKAEEIDIPSIFTIHNFLYHGHFSKDESLLLPAHLVERLKFTQWDNHSALLTAIDEADAINTVSPGYAEELLQGIDLDVNSYAHVLAAGDRLSGIVNGIDIGYWNPEKDTHIPHHYSHEDLAGKQLNKKELLEQSGLAPDLDRPLFGLISRLVENKGFPLIMKVVNDMVKQGARFVFLGSGDPAISAGLTELSLRYPEWVAFHHGYNEPLAHLIEAGADIFLMPSRFEPCGLNQLYSLRYGTIPLVNATGGLADTVSEVEDDKGTGFLMQAYTVEELRSAMLRAMNLYREPERWKALMLRGMRQDWSWESSAGEYHQLYQSLERAS